MLEELYKHAITMQPKTENLEVIKQHYFMSGFNEGKTISVNHLSSEIMDLFESQNPLYRHALNKLLGEYLKQ